MRRSRLSRPLYPEEHGAGAEVAAVVAAAMDEARRQAAAFKLLADDILDAWREHDWEWLVARGVVSADQVDTMLEEMPDNG